MNYMAGDIFVPLILADFIQANFFVLLIFISNWDKSVLF